MAEWLPHNFGDVSYNRGVKDGISSLLQELTKPCDCTRFAPAFYPINYETPYKHIPQLSKRACLRCFNKIIVEANQ